MMILKNWQQGTMAAALAMAAMGAQAAQLSGDARASIPKDVQQIIVVDYRAMQNSPAAMQLKDRVLPPELKRLENALKTSGLKVDQDADTLAFAAFRGAGEGTRIIGVAQGQFHSASILAYFAKNKTKPVMIRNTGVYPMGTAGMSVAFLNQTTMVFGDRDAVRAAIDARDGIQPSFLANGDMMNEMTSVDTRAVWSLLDQRGTQTMMKSVLGEAAQLADYETVKARMKSSRYTMDFTNGVRFEMAVVMSDTVTAATAATLMKGVMILKKNSGSPLEKSAMDETTIDSGGGTLTIAYASFRLAVCEPAGVTAISICRQVNNATRKGAAFVVAFLPDPYADLLFRLKDGLSSMKSPPAPAANSRVGAEREKKWTASSLCDCTTRLTLSQKAFTWGNFPIAKSMTRIAAPELTSVDTSLMGPLADLCGFTALGL